MASKFMSSRINNPGPVFMQPRTGGLSAALRNHLLNREVAVIAGAALLSLLGYLAASQLTLRIGFPLDDAWIHQTYARNLAQSGQWAFLPGQPSAGSTAPLWSALLAIGYRLGIGPHGWAFFLGWLCLVGVGLTGARLFRAWLPGQKRTATWAGVFLVLEWHLAWAAGSGMETLLFAWLVILALTELVEGRRRWFGLGLLVGASVWVRPDGVTLLGPVLLALWPLETGLSARLKAGLHLAAGVILTALPYLLFNQLLAGAWWPNTFFAKQAEYAVLRQAPVWQRLFSLYSLPLVGAGVLLLPGALWLALRAIRRRDIQTGGIMLWVAGYIALYAMRLPVTYQHGRYIIPAMPVYFVIGLAGMASWVDLSALALTRRVASRAWLLALALVTLAFWLIGANGYARDVAVIETEMVTTARWVDQNTPPDAVIAAHDIGALGYFARRPLLDLAGLVSPEVIPFIRDETHLAEYLHAQRAQYLVTFPGWYPQLVRDATLLYTTGGSFSPEQGGENMAVYAWGQH